MKLTGAGAKSLNSMIKAAQEKPAVESAKRRQSRAAARADPRPAIEVPTDNAPWLPTVDMLEGVHSSLKTRKPPSRDIDNTINRARKLPIPTMHAFTKAE